MLPAYGIRLDYSHVGSTHGRRGKSGRATAGRDLRVIFILTMSKPRSWSPQMRYTTLAFSGSMAPIPGISSKGIRRRCSSSQIGANATSWSSVQELPPSSSENELITSSLDTSTYRIFPTEGGGERRAGAAAQEGTGCRESGGRGHAHGVSPPWGARASEAGDQGSHRARGCDQATC